MPKLKIHNSSDCPPPEYVQKYIQILQLKKGKIDFHEWSRPLLSRKFSMSSSHLVSTTLSLWIQNQNSTLTLDTTMPNPYTTNAARIHTHFTYEFPPLRDTITYIFIIQKGFIGRFEAKRWLIVKSNTSTQSNCNTHRIYNTQTPKTQKISRQHSLIATVANHPPKKRDHPR